MEWVRFHSPDISLPVVRRRLGLELMELANTVGLFLTHGGWGLLNQNCYPNRKPYYNACQRLKSKGLAVVRREEGEIPRLYLTNEGQQGLAACFNAEKLWNRKWNGIWNLFVYDVPEKDRQYRDGLRQFLRLMRLGCLQQSVWITPNDIRAEYDDLVEAAQADAVSYLFEARTVLGLPTDAVVEGAWDFGRIKEVQQRYCEVFSENLELLGAGGADASRLVQLLRQEAEAFRSAFELDPLLPKALLPVGYCGGEVWRIHRHVVEGIARALNQYSSKSTAVDLEE